MSEVKFLKAFFFRLLNANFGKTCLFTKTGYQTRQTWSDLPGGNRNDSSDSHQTLLDGIHCESSNTFYVLDFVYWNGNRYQGKFFTAI